MYMQTIEQSPRESPAPVNPVFLAHTADEIIHRHMMLSMGVGAMPVAGADLIAVAGVQMEMIRQLYRLYEVPFRHQQILALVSSLLVSGLARKGARSLVKHVPFVGWLIGGAAVAMFSGASTYALGKVFQTHLAHGGEVADLRWEHLQERFTALKDKGQAILEARKTAGGATTA